MRPHEYAGFLLSQTSLEVCWYVYIDCSIKKGDNKLIKSHSKQTYVRKIPENSLSNVCNIIFWLQFPLHFWVAKRKNQFPSPKIVNIHMQIATN